MKHFLILFAVILTTIGCDLVEPHPSQHYDYYDNVAGNWIPNSKGRLSCGDTTMTAYEMKHTTAGIYQVWYLTPEGHRVTRCDDITWIETSQYPNFRKGEELVEAQLANIRK